MNEFIGNSIERFGVLRAVLDDEISYGAWAFGSGFLENYDFCHNSKLLALEKRAVRLRANMFSCHSTCAIIFTCLGFCGTYRLHLKGQGLCKKYFREKFLCDKLDSLEFEG